VARNLAVANAKGMTATRATTEARRLDYREALGRAAAGPMTSPTSSSTISPNSSPG
jgi:hypothetical protein